jgi:hypothetical protein
MPLTSSRAASAGHKAYLSLPEATGFRKLGNKACARLIKDLETQIWQLTHSLPADSMVKPKPYQSLTLLAESIERQIKYLRKVWQQSLRIDGTCLPIYYAQQKKT